MRILRTAALLLALPVALTGCAAGTDAIEAPEGGTRTVEHLFGETQVPLEPRRVVVLDSGSVLEAVLALGITPVGTLVPKHTGDYPAFIGDLLPDDLLELGDSEGEPNKERILQAEPDLIIVPSELGGQREFFDDVADLGPTIAVDDTANLWRDTLTTLGDALGESAEAERLLGDYDAHVAEVAELLGPEPGTLSVVRARADRLNYMGQVGAFIWQPLQDVGYQAPPAQDRGDAEDSFFDVSIENTELLDADRIIVVSDEPIDEPGGYLATIQGNPLFDLLTGTVEFLPSGEYLFGNILKAEHMLDHLEATARG